MTDDRAGDQTGDQGEPTASPDAWVRDILRCPGCGSALADGTAVDGSPQLVCQGQACALAYPVRDGIPVLLVEEAVQSEGTV